MGEERDVRELYADKYLAMRDALIKHGCFPCGRCSPEGAADAALAELGLTMDGVMADAKLSSIYRAAIEDIWAMGS